MLRLRVTCWLTRQALQAYLWWDSLLVAMAIGAPASGNETGKEMRRHWCDKVRIVGPMSYKLYFNNNLRPAPQRQNILKRTIDSWGRKAQNDIARLKVGIVGLGSGGSVVAEAVARIGVEQVVLIDHDRVKEHNLDRLLNATVKDIGRPKVEVAANAMRRSGTARQIKVTALPMSIQDEVQHI